MPRFRPGDALLVCDVQNDFLPGGSLPVPRGDEVVAPLDGWLASAMAQGIPTFATRDWHPEYHCSFRERGGPWPRHCVAGTHGAEFAAELHLPSSTIVISKASDPEREAYSSFDGTDLERDLRAIGVRRIFIGGLATEYCVLRTVEDARARGWDVVVLEDAIRAIDVQPGDGARAIERMKSLGARTGSGAPDSVEISTREPSHEALFTDLYQLTMANGYVAEGMFAPAAFELFVRKLPPTRGFLVAAGLAEALDYLEGLRFGDAELAFLRDTGRFGPELLDWLQTFRFTGDVDAIPEGTVVFENEPLVRVVAPMPEAQLVETRLMNFLHLQTMLASKAVRSVLVAHGKQLVDFGMRRAHGFEAAMAAARTAWTVGFAGTSNVLAGMRYGIPTFGTMAHSFVESFEDEVDAFRRFARRNPHASVLLIDTYDTERAATKLGALARDRVPIAGVRIDSGDLFAHARAVRRILDAAGLREVTIFASGGLDEHDVRELVSRGAPVDGFGIGTRLDTSADAPYLDCAYKLEEYAGTPRRKVSEGKATWPGRKQVFRTHDERGRMFGDTVTLVDDERAGEPLLVPVMRGGRRIAPAESLDTVRRRCADQRERLPTYLRQLEIGKRYPVGIAEPLRRMAEAVDRAR
jgi:nicotinate phosphoribosyltransferase